MSGDLWQVADVSVQPDAKEEDHGDETYGDRG